MKSSHSRCRKVQKTLLHSRRCYCIAKSFTAQQKVLLHSRKFYCTAESFTARQKSQSCGRNWRKVPSAAETEDKPTLQRLPLDLDSTFAHKLAATEWYFGAHSAKCQTQLPSQKKPKLSVVQLHQNTCLRYKKCKKSPDTLYQYMRHLTNKSATH